MNEIALPAGFADLQPFVRQWALAGLDSRAIARGAASQEELAGFHAAMKGRVNDALDYLDQRGLDRLAPAEAALLNMCLAFVHVALAIEMQGEVEPLHASWRSHMPVTHFPAEGWNKAG